jgi:hypothetical protein
MHHIEKFFPEAMWKYNHRVSSVKPGKSKSKYFVHRALEVWSALYPDKPFGSNNKNIISYSMEAMVYVEIELKKKVDWRTVFTMNKEDRTEYAKVDVLDNFSFFLQNVGVRPALDARGANRNTSRSTRTVRDEDSVGKVICFAKSKSRSEDEEGASASRKLDRTLPRLEGDIQDAGSVGGPNLNLIELQERINERDVDRVVDSVLNDVLDNDVSELEPRVSEPEGNHPWRFGKMVGGGQYGNLPDSDSLSLPNFLTQDYTPICEVVQPEPALTVPHSQDLLAIILNQTARPPKQPVPNLSVFDMTEDLPTTNINAEEEVMTIEPNTAGCGVEASGKQVQVADSGNCALQRIAAMAEHDEGEDDELSANDWEGVMVEDFDRLYRLLRS